MTAGQQKELLDLARFYESRENEKAAAVYYQALAKQHPEMMTPGSPMHDKLTSLLTKYPEIQAISKSSAPDASATDALSREPPPLPLDSPVIVPKAEPVE